MVEEYYLAKKKELQDAITYRYLNLSNNRDISDIYRGKLIMLDEVLDLKNIFERMDKMEKELKEKENEMRKGA